MSPYKKQKKLQHTQKNSSMLKKVEAFGKNLSNSCGNYFPAYHKQIFAASINKTCGKSEKSVFYM